MSQTPQPLTASLLQDWPPVWSPAAVVFDCDGLLVDTEGPWVVLQDDYLARHGVHLEPAVRREITGGSVETVVRRLAAVLGKDPYAVGADLQADYLAGDHTLRPFPGALETVRAVAAKRPVAIASNSPRESLDHKVAGLGLKDVVTVTVAVEDAAAPKPAPDLYLAAARALEVDPEGCLALEDSELGAQSARAAGMQLITVPSLPGQDPLGHRRLTSLEDADLQRWIAGWQVRG